MDSGIRQRREINPREKASILSIITFFFVYPLFKKSTKKTLEEDDVYEVVNSLSSENLGTKLERRWKQQSKKKGRSLALAILSSFGLSYIILGIIQFVVRTSLIFIQPTAISMLVAYFQPNQQTISKSDLYQNTALVIGLNFLTTIYNHNYEQFINEIGIKVRTAVAALIYRKALRLKPESFSDMTTGKIVTLITKDVFAFENALTFVNDMWIGLIQTIIIGYLLYQRISFSVVTGLGFYLLIIPFQCDYLN
nr:probable multidrug resistance-associated protein lethal(2)03659 [Leptinotarsa decemlineata]